MDWSALFVSLRLAIGTCLILLPVGLWLGRRLARMQRRRALLEALVACAGVTLNSVATALGVTLKNAVVRARGKWNARGTLGVDKTAAVGLTEIELSFDIGNDTDEQTKAKLVELTERYCVIYQTLRSSPRLGK